jgi:hypothetical protein
MADRRAAAALERGNGREGALVRLLGYAALAVPGEALAQVLSTMLSEWL